MSTITNNRTFILGNTTLAKALSNSIEYSIQGEITDIQKGDIVVSTQGTSRGTSKQIIDRCFTEIVEQAESLEKTASRFIIIGSIGAEYSSWPGIDNQRMIYNIAKSSLEKWAQDYNQKNFSKNTGINGMRIQMCEPAAFQSPMSNHTGLPIKEIIHSIKYLINNPFVIKIQLRK
jgi:NAD(P)-dependent dehydrogenase (short-subunit alcohol dehydrogenase family)